METIPTPVDLVNIVLTLQTTPLISFEKEDGTINERPNAAVTGHPNSFAVNVDMAVRYDALSHVVNQYAKGRRIAVTEGLFSQSIVLDDTELYGGDDGRLKIKTDFSGSFKGSFHFTGTPIYKADSQSIDFQNQEYDIVTKNLILKAAKWVFHKKIVQLLSDITTVSLDHFYTSTSQKLTLWLNKDWGQGIESTGTITTLHLVSIQALPEYVQIRSECKGGITIKIREPLLDAAR